MIKKFIRWFINFPHEPIVEGLMAHEYRDAEVRLKLLNRYNEVYPFPKQTPLTHPWKYDPLDPPEGWAWDPYYEIWIER